MCGYARVLECAQVLRPLVVEVGRIGTGQLRIRCRARGPSDRSTPKRTRASLEVVAAGKARGTAAAEEAGTAAAKELAVGAAAAKTAAAGKATVGGAAATVVSAGAASVEKVTAESAGRAATSEGAVWETAAP